MYRLELYPAADPTRLIDERQLIEGSLTIGRDPENDWPVHDATCVLSRQHCQLLARPEGLTVCAMGANGVYLGDERVRLPQGTETLLSIPCSLEFGDFRLVAHHMAMPEAPCAADDRHLVAAMPTNGKSLLEAFCQGAGIDSALLSGDDPEAIMRRAGEIYRETVTGIDSLMGERDTARRRFEVNRTTIAGAGNNPFKWSPSQRLALDLLLSGPSSFLSGPAAVRSSFVDLRAHLIANEVAMKETLRCAVRTFSPEELERAVSQKCTVLRNRPSAQLEEARRRHEDLSEQLNDERVGSLDQAFMRGYDSAEVAARSGQARAHPAR